MSRNGIARQVAKEISHCNRAFTKYSPEHVSVDFFAGQRNVMQKVNAWTQEKRTHGHTKFKKYFKIFVIFFLLDCEYARHEEYFVKK